MALLSSNSLIGILFSRERKSAAGRLSGNGAEKADLADIRNISMIQSGIFFCLLYTGMLSRISEPQGWGSGCSGPSQRKCRETQTAVFPGVTWKKFQWKYLQFREKRSVSKTEQMKQEKEKNMSRILLLEDDLSLINGLSFAFRKQGFELAVARTLKEADSLWADGKYDLWYWTSSCRTALGFEFCKKCGRFQSAYYFWQRLMRKWTLSWDWILAETIILQNRLSWECWFQSKCAAPPGKRFQLIRYSAGIKWNKSTFYCRAGL